MSKNKLSINIFLLIFSILLIVTYFRSIINYDALYFSSLLELLQDIPSINIGFNTISSITSDWVIFNFFRDFINMFISVFNVGLFLCSNVLNLLLFFGYILSSFFFIG